MKSPSRFKMSAAATVAALGVLVVASACGKDGTTEPPIEPGLEAPTNVTATVISETQIDVAWTDNSTTETGFTVESCSGPSCTNFTAAGTVAANVTTFSHTGLTAGTSYSYRVRATAEAGASDYSNTATAIIEGPIVTTAPILVGAGEITTCQSSAGPDGTAKLIEGMLGDTNVTVFTAGNNLADATAGTTYESCFDRYWGQFKDRTRYAVGNGDFEGGRGEAGVWGYFGERAGPTGKGWYSFDVGTWHIVVLNHSTWQQGSGPLQDANSEMHQWLRADLEATTQRCIMAISWERRIYTTSGGELGRNFNMNEAAEILYQYGADVIVSSKDKIYARFPQTNVDGMVDEANGFRQFIVGTGGRTFDNIVQPGGANPSPVEAQQSGTWGVVKFTLDTASYSWEFVPTVEGGFTDSGTTNCH